jgi:hypothetical protein
MTYSIGKQEVRYSWEVFTSRHRNALWAVIGVGAIAGLHQLAKRLNV